MNLSWVRAGWKKNNKVVILFFSKKVTYISFFKTIYAHFVLTGRGKNLFQSYYFSFHGLIEISNEK